MKYTDSIYNTYMPYVNTLPSFTKGMARTLDVGNTIDKNGERKNSVELDSEAVKNDWNSIGCDFIIACQNIENKINNS